MPLWTDHGHGFIKVPGAQADQASDAFLCCPGPSLDKVPDLRGPGRIVYALNTAYPKIKPDVWIGMDRIACFDRALWHEAFPKVARMVKGDTERMKRCPNVFYVDLEEADPASIFIRRDNESKFVWQRNSMILALHYMVWKGHKRIHLVGCDLGGARDYHDDRVLTPEQHANNRRLYASQLETIERLAPLAKRNGVELVSCTPGSPLNRFLPVLPLEVALQRCGAIVPPAPPPMHVFDAEDEAERLARAGAAATERRVVLVLKSGGDFRPAHVDRLVRQLPNCDVTVLTDADPGSFASRVKVIPLQHGWPGWWSKMELFRPDLPGLENKPFLFLDLDTTVRGLPEAFFARETSVALAPFTREEEEERRRAGRPHDIQSGVMLLQPADRAHIWRLWQRDPQGTIAAYRGDQDFLSVHARGWQRWQEVLPNAVASYKQNVLTGRGYDGSPLEDAAIKVVAFHGAPRPWEVTAPMEA